MRNWRAWGSASKGATATPANSPMPADALDVVVSDTVLHNIDYRAECRGAVCEMVRVWAEVK